MRRIVLSSFALAAVLSLSGCAGAIINSVSSRGPNSAELMVDVEAHHLFDYQQPNSILVNWAGYQARAPVPIKGGPQPELFQIVVNDWAYNPSASRLPITLVEVQYLLGSRVIRRRRFPSPLTSPKVIAQSIKAMREAPAAPPPAVAQQPRQQPPPPAPRDTPRTAEISTSLDRPTVHPYPNELQCFLDASSGARYLRIKQPPNKVVQLTIDVKSHGDPSATNEVTWWKIELLDSKGRPLPHDEKDMVDLGGEMRHIAEWRFDGSPVIFKLTSGSKAGDTIRIRFDEMQ